MELFLNVVWVLASLLITGLSLKQFLRRETRPHSLGTVLVALVAIAVLLFPVISLTDDLHSALFAFEDVSRKVAMLSILNAPVAMTAIIVASIMEALCGTMISWGLHHDSPPRAEIAGFSEAVADRAPPVTA